MSDQTTAAPSTRVTEAELLVLESDAGQWLVKNCPPGVMVNRLVAEIRRYRAMLLGLAKDGCPRDADGACAACGTVNNHDGTPIIEEFGHFDDCPWHTFEAEVAAIRAERKQNPKPPGPA